MRLCNDHFELIINFAEKHPQIITNAFVGVSGHKSLNLLWEQLVNELNSLGYGSLTISEYKRRLTDWKSKTKAKAAEMEKNLRMTGGGMCTGITLSNLEKRLLAIMGKKSYKGDVLVKEMGFSASVEPGPTTSKSPNRLLPDSNEKLMKSKLPEDLPLEMEKTSTIIISETVESGNVLNSEEHNYSFGITGTNKSTSTQRRQKITNLSEDIRKINDQTISILCQIDNNLTILNTNISNINNTITNKFDLLIKSIENSMKVILKENK